jgi:hypothetical protein
VGPTSTRGSSGARPPRPPSLHAAPGRGRIGNVPTARRMSAMSDTRSVARSLARCQSAGSFTRRRSLRSSYGRASAGSRGFTDSGTKGGSVAGRSRAERVGPRAGGRKPVRSGVAADAAVSESPHVSVVAVAGPLAATTLTRSSSAPQAATPHGAASAAPTAMPVRIVLWTTAFASLAAAVDVPCYGPTPANGPGRSGSRQVRQRSLAVWRSIPLAGCSALRGCERG